MSHLIENVKYRHLACQKISSSAESYFTRRLMDIDTRFSDLWATKLLKNSIPWLLWVSCHSFPGDVLTPSSSMLLLLRTFAWQWDVYFLRESPFTSFLSFSSQSQGYEDDLLCWRKRGRNDTHCVDEKHWRIPGDSTSDEAAPGFKPANMTMCWQAQMRQICPQMPGKGSTNVGT